jgi:hypothetical protein
LIAIVEADVPETCSVGIILNWKGIAELVLNAAEGPFLSEVVGPGISFRWPSEGTDVLNDATFLVIGFLDEETVILDLRRERHGNT